MSSSYCNHVKRKSIQRWTHKETRVILDLSSAVWRSTAVCIFWLYKPPQLHRGQQALFFWAVKPSMQKKPELLDYGESWISDHKKSSVLRMVALMGRELPPSNGCVISDSDVHWTQISLEQASLHVSKQTAVRHGNDWKDNTPSL